MCLLPHGRQPRTPTANSVKVCSSPTGMDSRFVSITRSMGNARNHGPVCGCCLSQVETFFTGQGCETDLTEALLRQSGDLETALPGWLREGFPLGIETVIENCGIFPATAADTAAVEALQIHE